MVIEETRGIEILLKKSRHSQSSIFLPFSSYKVGYLTRLLRSFPKSTSIWEKLEILAFHSFRLRIEDSSDYLDHDLELLVSRLAVRSGSCPRETDFSSHFSPLKLEILRVCYAALLNRPRSGKKLKTFAFRFLCSSLRMLPII